MPSRIVATPFIILALIFGAMAFLSEGEWAYWIVPNFIVLAVIYSLHPQIDWYWFEKHPPIMDEHLQKYVERLSSFYRQLNTADQQKFRDRVQLYLIANEYFLRGPEDNLTPPDDLKALFAIPLVELTFREKENWRLKKFERLVLYPTSFPSPNNHDLHAGEIETEDGVIIAALDLAKQWVDRPAQAFPMLHYQIAKAYLWSFMEKRNALQGTLSVEEVEKIGGLTLDELSKYLGEPELDSEALLLAYYYTKPEAFRKVAPNVSIH